jgi:hypothetical protein
MSFRACKFAVRPDPVAALRARPGHAFAACSGVTVAIRTRFVAPGDLFCRIFSDEPVFTSSEKALVRPHPLARRQGLDRRRKCDKTNA